MPAISRLLTAAMMAFALIGCTTTSERPDQTAEEVPATVPMRESIRIDVVPPSPTLPAKFTRFVGKWGGKWGGTLASNLYVERIDAGGVARGVYVWGEPPNRRFAAGATRFVGKISDDILTFGGNTKFEFRILPDGMLEGTRFVGKDNYGNVIMRRMTLP